MRNVRLFALGLLAALLPLTIISTAYGDSRHVVSPGETLSYLSQVYVVTIGEIADANGIANPDLIFPGQELFIPGGRSSEPPPSGKQAYVVQAGDTLSGIAYKYGIATAELQAANNLANPHFLSIGQKLAIPAPGEPAAPVETTVPVLPERPQNAELEAVMDELADQYSVDAGLLKAIALIESDWDQGAVSAAGAVGAMQLMPGTVSWLESDVFRQDLNETASAYDNVKMGARYLGILLGLTGGNERNAVAAYYQGLTPTEAGVFYPSTQDYVASVFAARLVYWP